MNNTFFIDEVRELVHRYFNQEISISKLTEILNEKAAGVIPETLTGIIIKHKPAPELLMLTTKDKLCYKTQV